jgi:hypothetical protein
VNRLIVVAAFLVACGGVGKKNVAACEEFVASLSDCDPALTTAFGEGTCEAYSETTCDISEYFTCNADYMATVCAGDPPPAEACTIPACE